MMNLENLRLVAKIDKNGLIESLNDDYYEWLGHKKGSLSGVNIKDIRGAFPEPVVIDMRETLLKGIPYSFWSNEKKKSGESYWTKMNCQPIFEGDSYLGYVSVKRVIYGDEEIKARNIFDSIDSGKLVIKEGVVINKIRYKINKALGLYRFSTMGVISIYSTAFLLAASIGFYSFENKKESDIQEESLLSFQSEVGNLLDFKLAEKFNMGEVAATGLMKSPKSWMMVNDGDLGQAQTYFGGIRDAFSSRSILKNIKVDITDENGISWYRSANGDNQVEIDEKNRGYIRKQLSNPEMKTVVGLGSGGLGIRTLYPVYNFDQEYGGTVEFIQMMGSIHRALLKENIYFTPVISKSYLQERGGTLSVNLKNEPIGGDDGFVVGHQKKLNETESKQRDSLSVVDISSVAENGIHKSEGFIHIFKPVVNNIGNTIGYYILSTPSDAYNAKVGALIKPVKESTIIGFSSLVLGVFLVLIFIYFLTLRPLKRTKDTISKAVSESDLFARLDGFGKNEFAQLSKAYNEQAMLTQYAVAETQMTLVDIESGGLNRFVDYDFKSDFGLLKNSLNNTSKGLQDTFVKINEVMDDLKTGNFSAEHSNDLNGAYFNVVEDCKSAMGDLTTVFNEINLAMQEVSKGNFDHEINVESSGEIAALANVINEASDHLKDSFSDVVSAARRMAEGDFTQPIVNSYEFTMDDAKQAINKSMSDLRETISGVIDVASSVGSAISSIAKDTESLNDRTQEQAASLEETSSAMEETATQVESNLESTRAAFDIAEGKKLILNETNKTMNETQSAMSGIKEASEKIKNITDLIDSISFQTNLLALNAAVEAARAGEHGRGFAVVASEVRGLAGKSADAAKEIKNLVDQTSDAIKNGVEKVDVVNGFIQKITDETDKIRSVVLSIRQASDEQSTGVNEVNKAITSIDSVTQQNAALVEKTYSTVEKVIESSNELLESVSRFKV